MIWYFTTGILFFGTPHRGVNTNMYNMLASILRTVSSNPDPGFLRSLKQYSEEAERLHERFSMVHEYYQFVSVYETRPHRIKSLGVVSNVTSSLSYKWSRSLLCLRNMNRSYLDGLLYSVYQTIAKVGLVLTVTTIRSASSPARTKRSSS